MRKGGFTLLELMVNVALFSLVTALLLLALGEGLKLWQRIDSSNQVQKNLNQAFFYLRNDLEQADPGNIARKRVTSSAGNGDVIWFLSAKDPAQTNRDLAFIRDPATGAAEWQTNVSYYLIRPNNYQALSNGYLPAIDPDPNNDFYAPHKLLIRKIVDTGDPETLLSPVQVDQYTTAPNGFDLSGFGAEPGLVESKVVASSLLSFENALTNNAATIDLRAARIREAEKSVAVGNVSLRNSRFTTLQRGHILLKN